MWFPSFSISPVEISNAILAILVVSAAVDAAVVEGLRHKVVLDNVEHARHLTKDEHTVPLGFHTHQQFVHEVHLATRLVQVWAKRWQGAVLNVGEEVGVVAALAQLHDDVEDGGAASLAFRGHCSVDTVDVA